tara:strand:+ start:505 stop:693 length:189 start_codon:yes stop_codon:yes gene_type:complete
MSYFNVKVVQTCYFPQVEANSKEEAERKVKNIEPNQEEEYIWDETAKDYKYTVTAIESVTNC